MLSMKALMRFLDRGFVIRLLLLVMLFSLVPFGECFLLLFINDYVETYILLSIVAASALVGLLLVIRPITSTLRSVHESIDGGYYPDEPFAMLAGTLINAILLITPGFATDFIGLVLLFPFLRRGLGRMITRRMHGKLLELYEYIKLYEH